MAADTQRLLAFWTERKEAFIETYANDLQFKSGPFYRALPLEDLRKRTLNVVDLWFAALKQSDGTILWTFAKQLASDRSAEGMQPSELMTILDLFRERLWELLGQLYIQGDWDIDLIHLLEGWIHGMRSNFTNTYGQYLHDVLQELTEREHDVEAQGRIIQEISSPIVPIFEGVLVLPLVGAVDSRRASQAMESALEQIVEHQAEILILDITGVPVVDTSVANHLLQMARAVTLLGAQVVLVGIGSEIAQTIVQLGLDMSNIRTMADLQAGIAYALSQQGLVIVEDEHS